VRISNSSAGRYEPGNSVQGEERRATDIGEVDSCSCFVRGWESPYLGCIASPNGGYGDLGIIDDRLIPGNRGDGLQVVLADMLSAPSGQGMMGRMVFKPHHIKDPSQRAWFRDPRTRRRDSGIPENTGPESHALMARVEDTVMGRAILRLPERYARVW